MANAFVLDHIVTIFTTRFDSAAAGKVRAGMNQLSQSVGKTSRNINKSLNNSLGTTQQKAKGVAREIGLLIPLLAGLGRVFYQTGREVEFSFTKLRTQLGLSVRETKEAQLAMKNLAIETGRQWEELGRGYFSLRSAGVSQTSSMETMEYAAKAAAIGLGDVQDIALLAAGALNSFGESNISAQRAVEALLQTVKLGNIKDATVLARQMPQLLPHASRLGIAFEELGAGMATYTRTGADPARVAVAIKRALSKSFTPTKQGIKLLEEYGLTTAKVRAEIKSRGWFNWLNDFTRNVLKGDPDAIRRYFQDQRALGFVNDFIGKSDQYMWVLERMHDAAGTIDDAMGVVDETGVSCRSQGVGGLEGYICRHLYGCNQAACKGVWSIARAN